LRINFILALAKFDGYSWLRRAPATTIGYTSMPLALLFLIYVLSGGRLVEYAVAGGLVALMSTTAIMVAGSTAVFRIQLRIQDLLVATNATKVEYMFGMAVANLIFCVPGLIIYAVLGLYFGLFTPVTVLITAIVLLLLTVAVISIAVYVGSIFKSISSVWTTASMLGVILTMIPPTYYPYTLLPKPILYIVALSPVTPASVILQGYYGLAPVNNYMFLVLFAEAVIYLSLARKYSRWGDN
jgi:ABC-2 type transport system permease protein